MPDDFDPAYQAALAALPSAASMCETCKVERVQISINDTTNAHRFACPRCQVVKNGDIDALRDPIDPHWRWLPESVRDACARAGYGLGGDARPTEQTGYLYQLGIFFDTIWASEGSGVLLDTGAPASDLAKYEVYMPWGDMDEAMRAEFRVPAGPMNEAYIRRQARQSVHSIGGTPSWAAPGEARYVGSAAIQARYWRLLEAIHPGRLTWHASGEKDGVAACVGERPVAVVMPVIEWEMKRRIYRGGPATPACALPPG